MRKIFFNCVVLLGFCCGVFAQDAIDRDMVADSNYIIGEYDVISVSVWKEPDFSAQRRSVRPDGTISIPFIGDVYAIGKTARQLQDEIAEKVRSLVIDPIVYVEVEEIYSIKVSISGQVVRAGNYAIGASTTVLDIINSAAGLNATAKSKKIKIARIENGRSIQFLFNYKDVINGKNLDQNIPLKNGDMILVP